MPDTFSGAGTAALPSLEGRVGVLYIQPELPLDGFNVTIPETHVRALVMSAGQAVATLGGDPAPIVNHDARRVGTIRAAQDALFFSE